MKLVCLHCSLSTLSQSHKSRSQCSTLTWSRLRISPLRRKLAASKGWIWSPIFYTLESKSESRQIMRTPHPSSQKIVPIIPKVYFLKKCKKKSSRGTGLSRYAWKMVIKWSSGYILLGKMQTQLPATAAYEGGAPVEFCAVLTANICGIV